MSIGSAVLLGLVVLALVYGVVIYNGLVQLKHNLAKAWANIDVLLKQRHDELPKLVEVCRQRQPDHRLATAECHAKHSVQRNPQQHRQAGAALVYPSQRQWRYPLQPGAHQRIGGGICLFPWHHPQL